MAALAAALVGAAAAAALAGACTSGSGTTPVDSDAGAETGSVQTAECPTLEPTNGSVCILPEGTTCEFGQCGSRLARCTRSAWNVGTNAAPSPPCPADPPSGDSKCPACWPPQVSCTYGSSDCSAADASVNTAIASCPNGTWILDIRPCRDGGIDDSGPDVQGDAGTDAD
jgi:hypothetical protein